jgi:hypothetical protein
MVDEPEVVLVVDEDGVRRDVLAALPAGLQVP